MMPTAKTLALIGALTLYGCEAPSKVNEPHDDPAADQAPAPPRSSEASVSNEGGNDVAAVVAAPNPESRAELRQVVSSALHDAPVMLADDALTQSSLLVIERKVHRTLEGRVGNDRTMEAPEQFRLVLQGSRCVLVHVNTGVRYWLTHARCEPEQSPR